MIFRFGNYSLNDELLELRSGEKLVGVEPQVFRLIAYLIKNRDQVVGKDELIENIWDSRIVSDAALNSRINLARKAVGDSGKTQSVIKTFPRRGFRFVAEGSEGDANLETPVATAPPAVQDKPSVAVLPFKNLSDDPEQQFFSDGITEDLITDLSKVPELFVIARNSAFSYRDSSADVDQIGRELGTGHVLEGSVRRAGDRVRINAQLVDVSSGRHVWAERYDGDIGDIFALQDEITAQIVAALQVNLTSHSPQMDERRATHSVQAYETFLQGRAAFFLFTPEAFANSIALLEKAASLDPGFAYAWSSQVFPYQSGWSFMWDGYDDAIYKAHEVARQGVSIDGESSFTNWRLGWALNFLGKNEEAVSCFERALEINPNDAEAYAYFAEVLNFAGDPARAVEMTETSLRYDPVVPPNCAFHLGHSYFLLERLEAARQQIQRSIDLAPGFPVSRMIMAATLVELNQEQEAKKHIETLLGFHPRHSVTMVGERYPYKDNEARSRVLSRLREAGLPK